MCDQLDTGLLSDCLPEVTRMARKFSHISTLLQYLRLSLTCMCEAWEEILMQMDLRLTKFVQVDRKIFYRYCVMFAFFSMICSLGG